MATLAAINKTLERVDDNTETTSKGINSFITYLKDNKRKDLEAAREAKDAITKNAQAGAANATNNAGKKADGSGLLSGVRNILAGATLARLAPMLGKTLLKRVLGPAAIALFAEDIVEMLLPDGLDNPDLKEALTGGLQGAALGFAIGGPLGAAIGGGVGALMTNEKFKKAVGDLGKTLKEQAIVLYDKIEPTVTRFKDSFIDMFNALGITKEGVVAGLAGALTTIGNAAASGVESLTKIAKGDFSGMDLVKGIGLLGTVAAVLMPGKFMKLFGALAVMAKGNIGKTLTGIVAGGGALLSSAASMLGMGGNKDMVTAKSGKQYNKNSPQGKMIQNMTSKTAQTGAQVGAGVAKYPKLAKALGVLRRVPFLGSLAALTQIAMMDPVTVTGLSKILGGVGGSALGAAIGSFGGPLGTFAGGLAGFLAGETGGLAAAQFLMGKKVDAFGFGFGWINDLLNGVSGGAKSVASPITETGNSKPLGSDSMRMGRGGPTQTFNKPAVTTNNNSQKLKNNVMVVDDLSGSKSGPTVIGGDNNTTNNNSSTNVSSTSVVGRSGVLDPQDQFGFMPT